MEFYLTWYVYSEHRFCGIWLGIANGQISSVQFLTELSVCHMSIFLFPDDNLSKCQWIFFKLGVYIDIVKIWFGIANGQISSDLTELLVSYWLHIHIF